MACLHAGHAAYWLSPSRLAEQRLPPGLLERYSRLTADLAGLDTAYAEALAWTEELAGTLTLRLPTALLPTALLSELRLAGRPWPELLEGGVPSAISEPQA